jgi:hypothetical protein
MPGFFVGKQPGLNSTGNEYDNMAAVIVWDI